MPEPDPLNRLVPPAASNMPPVPPPPPKPALGGAPQKDMVVWVTYDGSIGDFNNAMAAARALNPKEIKVLPVNEIPHNFPAEVYLSDPNDPEKTVLTKLNKYNAPHVVIDACRNNLSDRFKNTEFNAGQAGAGLSEALKKAYLVKMALPDVRDCGPHPGYDMVVAQKHHNFPFGKPANLLLSDSVPSRITPDLLNQKFANTDPAFKAALAKDGKPNYAVLLGERADGNVALSVEDSKIMARQLAEMVKRTGGSVFISTSRRTSPEALKTLQEELAKLLPPDTKVYAYDYAANDGKNNPYLEMMGMDKIVVTGDSMSMMADAVATGRDVYIVDRKPTQSTDETTKARVGLLKEYAENIKKSYGAGTLGDPANPPDPRRAGNAASLIAQKIPDGFLHGQRPGFSVAGNMLGLKGGIDALLTKNENMPDTLRYLAGGTQVGAAGVGLGADLAAKRARDIGNLSAANSASKWAMRSAGVATALQLPADLAQAIGSFRKGEVYEGSLHAAGAVSGGFILASIVSNGRYASAGPIGIGIAIGKTGIETVNNARQIAREVRMINELKERLDHDNKTLFKPGISELYVKYHEANVKTKVYKLPLPSVGEYKNLGMALRYLTGPEKPGGPPRVEGLKEHGQSPPPDKLLTGLNSQIEMLEREKARLTSKYPPESELNAPGRKGRPANASTYVDASREEIQTVEGRQRLRLVNTDPDSRLVRDLDEIEKIDDKLRMFKAARVELVGDENGVIGGNKLVGAYKKRYELVQKYKADNEKAVKEIEPHLPAMSAAAEQADKLLAADREHTSELENAFASGFGALPDDDKQFLELKARAEQLEAVYNEDKTDKFAQAMMLDARLQMQAKEPEYLKNRQQKLAAALVKQAEQNPKLEAMFEEDMRKAPGDIHNNVAKRINSGELAPEIDRAAKAGDAYKAVKAEVDKLKAEFNKRFGDVENQKKLLDSKNPEYIQELEKIQAAEAKSVLSYARAVGEQRRLIERKMDIFADEKFKFKYRAAQVEARVMPQKERTPDAFLYALKELQRKQGLGSFPLAREDEGKPAGESFAIELTGPPGPREAVVQELQAMLGAKLRANATPLDRSTVVRIELDKLKKYMQDKGLQPKPDGSIDLVLPSGKILKLNNVDYLKKTTDPKLPDGKSDTKLTPEVKKLVEQLQQGNVSRAMFDTDSNGVLDKNELAAMDAAAEALRDRIGGDPKLTGVLSEIKKIARENKVVFSGDTPPTPPAQIGPAQQQPGQSPAGYKR